MNARQLAKPMGEIATAAAAVGDYEAAAILTVNCKKKQVAVYFGGKELPKEEMVVITKLCGRALEKVALLFEKGEGDEFVIFEEEGSGWKAPDRDNLKGI